MLGVTGYRTTIIQELADIIDEPIVRISADLSRMGCRFSLPEGVERFVLAAGMLVGRPIEEQTAEEISRGFAVNCVNVVRICERILDTVPHARVCVIGSMSGVDGSYDTAYAVAKAAVHGYVSFRKVTEHQQIVAVAPTVISNSGMTWRRHDYPDVLTSRKTVTARQVADMVKRLLYGREPLSNCVVPVKPC